MHGLSLIHICILLAGFKSAKASISSQTPVQDPGYPIDVDGQAPTNQVQADTEVVTEEVFKPTSAKLVAVGDNLMHRSCTLSAKNADGTYDFTKHFANMADIFKACLLYTSQRRSKYLANALVRSQPQH